VGAQLPQNLLHLKCGGQGLDQDGRLHRAGGQADRVLGVQEHLIPQAGLQVGLHFGQVKVGPRPARHQLARVVPEEQPEIKQGARDGDAVHRQVRLRQVPAPGSHKQDGRVRAQGVRLAGGTVGEGQAAVHGGRQVGLAPHQGGPGGRGRVLKVGHVDLGSAVEGVDDHLGVDGPRDLDPPILQVGRRWGHTPGGVGPDVRGVGQEGRPGAGVVGGLDGGAAGQQLLHAGRVRPGQVGQEG